MKLEIGDYLKNVKTQRIFEVVEIILDTGSVSLRSNLDKSVALYSKEAIEDDFVKLLYTPAARAVPRINSTMIGDTEMNSKAPLLGKPPVDLVNQPPHYTSGGIEVIDFIEAKQLGYNLGCVTKYIARAGKKEGASKKQDLEKARWYLNREIEHGTFD